MSVLEGLEEFDMDNLSPAFNIQPSLDAPGADTLVLRTDISDFEQVSAENAPLGHAFRGSLEGDFHDLLPPHPVD